MTTILFTRVRFSDIWVREQTGDKQIATAAVIIIQKGSSVEKLPWMKKDLVEEFWTEFFSSLGIWKLLLQMRNVAVLYDRL